MSNLYEANHQWSTRPDDERFSSLQEMRDATRKYAQAATEKMVPVEKLRVEAYSGDLFLMGPQGGAAKFTHYSFGQVASLAGAPPAYLRKLPATLAAQNINHGLKAIGDEKPNDQMNVLLHNNGRRIARAVTSDNYDRVWNYEVIDAILRRTNGTGWRAPPARPAREGQAGTRLATEADILPNQGDFGLQVKVGDPIAPAGLYASDHDMFVFLVNQGGVSDGQKLLNQGIFIQNSEVGDCGLRMKMFLYDNVCGNHIVWGVSQVTEVSVRHVKSANVTKGNTLDTAMKKWRSISSAIPNQRQMEETIRKARELVLGTTRDEALETVFTYGRSKGLGMLTRGTLEAAYALCEQSPRYGSPRNLWGVVNGLTEFSQQGQTDLRTDLDIQAGRLMGMVG